MVLTVRLWSKLGGVRTALKGGSLPGGGIGLVAILLAGLFVAYYLFQKALKPLSWRSKWSKQGVPTCPDWMPVTGNYNALSRVAAKAKSTSEPYQDPYSLIQKEYFCDESGRYEPLTAISTPYGDHLVINQIEVAEQFFAKNGEALDKSNA